MTDSLLQQLVSIYSPSEREAPAVAHLVSWMAAHGFDAKADAAGNAVGVKGSGDKLLVLLGHIDTVEGIIEVRTEGDLFYGRGSVDAKGPLCAFAEGTASATIPDGWRVMVVGAVEEESATSKGALHIRDMVDPALCIIGEPSGTSRITLGYKGRLIAEYTLTQPRTHGARPEPTVGALAADVWSQVMAWVDSINSGRERYFDRVMPSLRKINTSSDGLYETVTMTLGFRLPTDVTPDDVRRIVREIVGDQGTLRTRGAETAYLSDKRNAAVRGMLAAIRAQGVRPAFVLKTGTSDMNVVGSKWDCPMVAYGPGDSNLDHTPNEHISLTEYQQAIHTLTYFIENLNDIYRPTE